ncbi:YdcF family protein [Gymnodinialimonas sp.]
MNVRQFGRVLGFCLMVYVATMAVVAAVHVYWPSDSASAEAEAIVCLGGGSEDGVLFRSSGYRTLQCMALFEAGAAPRIVFTGSGAAPLMADYAAAQGVPREAMVVESDSRSTLQNALFTSRIVPPDARVIVVSDAYHLPRAFVAFRVMGFENIALAASTSRHLRLKSMAREAAAVWFNFARVVLWWATPWLPDNTREALLI